MRNYGLSPRQGGVQATPTGSQYRAMAPAASRAAAFHGAGPENRLNRADTKPDDDKPKDDDKKGDETKPEEEKDRKDDDDKEKEPVATSHQSWW